MKHTKTINKIKDIIKNTSITPQQLRYVFKQVRTDLKLTMPNVPKKLPIYLTPSEIYHFLDTANKLKPKYRLLAEFMIVTGLRVNEASHVMVSDFHDNNQLLVRKGKGRKERYVPYTNSLYNKIMLYMGGRKGYLWVDNHNRRYNKRTLQNWIKYINDSANLNKNVHAHSLRHTFACLMMSKGMSLEELKTLMGHSSIKTTEIYGRLELGQVKDKYLQFMGDM